MKQRTLLSVLMIGLVCTLAGVGTFASFRDTETSTGNTFKTGTLDVKIRDGGYPYQDDIGAVWILTDMKPGDESGSRSFDFKNVGSISIDHMEITCDYSVTEETPQTEADTDPNTDLHPDRMAENFTIITLEVYEDVGPAVDLLPFLDDINNNGVKDLYDLKYAGVDDVTTVPDANSESYTAVDMELEFNPNAGNDFQGDTLRLDMIFTFNQDSSQ